MTGDDTSKGTGVSVDEPPAMSGWGPRWTSAPDLTGLGVFDRVAIDGRFSWLCQGLRSVELDDDLKAGPYTLIAPTDAAFNGVASAAGGWLFHPERVEERFDFFDHLVLEGLVPLPDQGTTARQTLQGALLTFGPGIVRCPTVTAPVLETLQCRHGIVHVIDRLLTPLLSDVLPRTKAS